jgi:hypothetical protein
MCTSLSGLSGGEPQDGGTSDAAPDTTAGTSSYAAAVLADQPIAYYPLDETSGNTVRSAVPNAPDGTFTRGVTLGRTSPVTRNLANRAAAFDVASGESDLAFGNFFSFAGNAPYSVELWTMPTAGANDGKYHHLFSKCDRNATAPLVGWNLVTQGMTLGVWAERIVAGAIIQTPAVGLTLDTFTHVVAVYDGIGLRVYLNGSQSSGPTPDPRLLGPSTTAAFAGAANGGTGHGFIGLIDEIAIYDRPLTPEQVAAHYAAGKP